MAFEINPLRYPEPVKPQTLDFTPLNQIGDVLAAENRKRQIATALGGATDAQGNIDISKAGTALAKIGEDPRPWLELAIHKQQLAQTLAHQRATEDISRAHLALSREQYEAPKPTVQMIPGTLGAPPEFYEIGVGRPVRKLISQEVAQQPGSTVPIVPTAVPTQSYTGAPGLAAPAGRPLSQLGEPTPQPPEPSLAAPEQPPIPPAPPAPARRSELLPAIDEAKLAKYPEKAQQIIRGIAEYRTNPQTLSARGSGGGDRAAALAAASDVTNGAFDQTFYPRKQQTENAFARGMEARQVRAVNNLVDHLGLAEQLVKALGGSDIGAIRSLQAQWQRVTGSPAPTNIDALGPIVGGETLKVIAQSGAGGVFERAEAAAKTLGTARGEKQALEAINVVRSAMAPQIQSLERQYETNTMQTNFRQMLSPKTKKFLEGYEGKSTEAAGPALGQTPIPIPAARMLQANPALRDQFDAKYGAGASDRVLGPQR